ncbi:hypothetical protein FB446DRAFT_703191 [Lentinula raphanica]|nr:hypothetical protein FB446DRAFT_703191 [Lentinula raphanica]
MPKSPRTPSTPATRTPTKRETIQGLTEHVLRRLKALRGLLSLPLSARQPSIQPGETIRASHIFSGVSQDVDGPEHRYFDRLGRIFFVVSRPDASIRIVWDEATIPRQRLAADAELIQLLSLRSMASRIGRQSSRQLSRTSSTSCTSSMSRTTSSTPTTPSSDVLPASPTVLVPASPTVISPRSARPVEQPVPAVFPLATPSARRVSHTGQVARHVQSTSSDDEIEFVSFRRANGEVLSQKSTRELTHTKAQTMVASNSSPPDSSITVVLIAWHADTVLHTTVKLDLQSGQFMMLSMVGDALQLLKINEVAIDRYITTKGWTRILKNTLFRVQDGDIVSLKPSSLQHVEDFGIHAAHLY